MRYRRAHVPYSLLAAPFLALLWMPLDHADWLAADERRPEITRVLPPVGLELPTERIRAWEQRRAGLEVGLDALSHPLAADVRVFLKAVEYAVRHREFYQPSHFDLADKLLDAANQRLDQLRAGTTPWTSQRGLVARGYESSIDGSPQPYGLVIPQDLDLSQPVPLFVWLHGRGDQLTDLHFLNDRMTKAGQISPSQAIVLHPYGRHCVGYKHAGETDVLEAIAHVSSQYAIDPNRIVLIGFSMGGAGAWHIGAHFADQFVAVSPGAGFVETARYNNLQPADYPPPYEQLLWGQYDVPAYVRNLFNVPTIAYSGEEDKQIQAARMMEDAFQAQGRTLTHVIGPGVGHKYHPQSLQEILEKIHLAVERGRVAPGEVVLQTRTLRYHRMFWVDARGLGEHWKEARVDAKIVGDRRLTVATANVTSLRLSPYPNMDGVEIQIDGQPLVVRSVEPGQPVTLARDDRWSVVESAAVPGEGEPEAPARLAKQPGLQGPIDDAFSSPFLVVTPSGKSSHAAVETWVRFELDHFLVRWRALMRGEARVKRDTDVTDDDLGKYHLVLWGDRESNLVLARIADRLPMAWGEHEIRVGDRVFSADHHVPVLIHPNPLRPGKYVVVNSGHTFREGHDKTNSLQNPKLPDWAILDLTQPPDALSAGRVAAADFFDEAWQIRTAGERSR